MKNQEIKEVIRQSGVKFYEVADQLGIADTTFCRRLRKELPEEEKEKIRSIIKGIKEGEAHA